MSSGAAFTCASSRRRTSARPRLPRTASPGSCTSTRLRHPRARVRRKHAVVARGRRPSGARPGGRDGVSQPEAPTCAESGSAPGAAHARPWRRVALGGDNPFSAARGLLAEMRLSRVLHRQRASRATRSRPARCSRWGASTRRRSPVRRHGRPPRAPASPATPCCSVRPRLTGPWVARTYAPATRCCCMLQRPRRRDLVVGGRVVLTTQRHRAFDRRDRATTPRAGDEETANPRRGGRHSSGELKRHLRLRAVPVPHSGHTIANNAVALRRT